MSDNRKMTRPSLLNELSYFSLFDAAEAVRWKMSDFRWEEVDTSKISEELILAVETALAGELTTFSATRAFMDLFSDDVDFTQWLAVWFYEETKHPHALLRWLAAAGKTFDTSYIQENRRIVAMRNSRFETLCFNIASEITAAGMYRQLARLSREPILCEITNHLAKDETRHSHGFETYCRKLLAASDDLERDRLVCLRTIIAYLGGAGFTVAHPVALTEESLRRSGLPPEAAPIQELIVKRISRVIGIDCDSPTQLFDAYRQMSSQRRRSTSAIL